jgi:hypothetical protein
MVAERRFADAEQLADLVREVFGTDRRITTLERLPNGSKKGVYRTTLDDGTSSIVYVWSPEEDYWDGLIPEHAKDPANPLSQSSGIDLFEAATRRLASIGVRSPRALFIDRSRKLYPAEIAVAEDVTGGTLEALLERDPEAGGAALAQLAEMLGAMGRHRAARPRSPTSPTPQRAIPEQRGIVHFCRTSSSRSTSRSNRVRSSRWCTVNSARTTC